MFSRANNFRIKTVIKKYISFITKTIIAVVHSQLHQLNKKLCPKRRKRCKKNKKVEFSRKGWGKPWRLNKSIWKRRIGWFCFTISATLWYFSSCAHMPRWNDYDWFVHRLNNKCLWVCDNINRAMLIIMCLTLLVTSSLLLRTVKPLAFGSMVYNTMSLLLVI